MVLRMAILTDDAGEKFENVPRPRFNFGNENADNGLRTRRLMALVRLILQHKRECIVDATVAVSISSKLGPRDPGGTGNRVVELKVSGFYVGAAS
ncbi:unnamed protein product [Protopolystoma xenopodis]|uniref:Uncharacterized protein n=1 Tax=Protopolystoma xenopodis TaxID=117903 RepID=A0A3S5CGU5_9PLAT|nr:unnamed protein product [Protopolystoma xenopodis]